MINLESNERLQLHEALEKAYPDVQALRLMVGLRMGAPLATFASEDNPLSMVVYDLIQAVEARGRLEELVEGAHAQNSENPRLRAFYETLWPAIKARAAAKQQQTDPSQVLLLDGVLPFINRLTLRRTVVEMAMAVDHGGRLKILNITGGKKRGKSYSLAFVAHMARMRNFETVTLIVDSDPDLAHYTSVAPSPSAQDVADHFALRLGADRRQLPEPRPDKPNEWAAEVATWITTQVKQAVKQNGKLWWIVVDDFDKHLPDTRELIQGLVRGISAETSPLRFVLINYPPPTPTFQRRIHQEQLDEAPIGSAELLDFFTLLYRQRQRACAEGELEALVEALLQQLPAGEQWLAEMQLKVLEELDRRQLVG